jgi:CRISPR-associated protein Csy2
MSTYITLKHIQIQNANCVAGLTYGFPAVTHFLGYIHALSRKLQQSHQLTLGGCAIVCHQHQTHKYQPKGWGDYIFAQTRNPSAIRGSKYLGKSSPIIEEGKMHLTVSLVVECIGLIAGGEAGINLFQQHLKQLCLTQKLAGGVINQINQVVIESASTDDEQKKLTGKIRRRLLPGFLLLDRSEFLSKHLLELQKNNPDAQMLDAWLDFSALKFQAEPDLKEGEEFNDKTKAHWKYVPKPNSGYLVPITTGYRAISEVYPAGKVANIRDLEVPFCFVEAAYGIGEWQSPHRLQDIQQALWHYQYQEGWYLCTNSMIEKYETESEEDNFDDQ